MNFDQMVIQLSLAFHSFGTDVTLIRFEIEMHTIYMSFQLGKIVTCKVTLVTMVSRYGGMLDFDVFVKVGF